MESRDQRLTAFRDRATRARALASRFPEAAPALDFYAELATLQSDSPSPDDFMPRLVELVSQRGPETLERAAAELDIAQAIERYRSGEDRRSPQSFFARALLQLELRDGCPGEHPAAQLAVLRPEGDGTRLALACALCFEEWPLPRAKCPAPACGSERDASIVRYAAEEMPQIEVRACEDCRRYVNLVRLDVEPLAIPDVDEMAALALDVKARALGFEKLLPNLVGI